MNAFLLPWPILIPHTLPLISSSRPLRGKLMRMDNLFANDSAYVSIIGFGVRYHARHAHLQSPIVSFLDLSTKHDFLMCKWLFD